MSKTIRKAIIESRKESDSHRLFADLFHDLRKDSIAEGTTPLSIEEGPKVVIHAIPESAYENDTTIEFDDLRDEKENLPFYRHTGPRTIGAEFGLVGYHHNNPLVSGEPESTYTLVTQTGILEIVSDLPFDRRDDNYRLLMSMFETGVSAVLSDSLSYLDDKNIDFPIRTNLSIVETGSYELYHEQRFQNSTAELPSSVEPLGVTMDSPDVSVREALEPISRNSWRMPRKNESPHYDYSEGEREKDAEDWYLRFKRE
jgi:hypothetical protein